MERKITHDKNHYDIERLVPVFDKDGIVEETVWAVVKCVQTEENKMEDTTATLCKEWIEEKKSVIDNEIDRLIAMRDMAEDEQNEKIYHLLDEQIDRLLSSKDNLSAECPFRHPVEAAYQLEKATNDPRSEGERAWDGFCDETYATRNSDDPRAGW
jgi:hypothetical protein